MWQILEQTGPPRLGRRDDTRRGSDAKLNPVKAAAQPCWPAGATIGCGHAGLLLLFPAITHGLFLILKDFARQAFSVAKTCAIRA